MSRDTSRERSAGRSPTPHAEEPQEILKLTSSPGSSRKGEEDGIHIPNFSKEVSLDSTEDEKMPESESISRNEEPLSNIVNPQSLNLLVEKKISISPKGILKRKHSDKVVNKSGSEDSPRTSKCCHPFVEKIKHIADKTLHRTDKSPVRKSVTILKGLEGEHQEILILESSPGTERRQKNIDQINDDTVNDFTVKEDRSKEICRKPHIYEDIDPQNVGNLLSDKKISFTPDTIAEMLKSAEHIDTNNEIEKDLQEQNIRATSETKSGASLDPSLQIDEDVELEDRDRIMHLMKSDKIIEAQREALVLESDESFEENSKVTNYPNLTITDVTDDAEEITNNNIQVSNEALKVIPEPTETQESNSIQNTSDEKVQPDVNSETQCDDKDEWSKTGDHEYEPIGKVQNGLHFEKLHVVLQEAQDDDMSSTTSQERKYLHGLNNDDIEFEEGYNHNNEGFNGNVHDENHLAETLQREIEDRYFINTPTTTESRTDCEISTSQVDSSALENLPLKRDSRNKFTGHNLENTKQKFRNQTTRLRSQADKLRIKIKNMKKPNFSMPEKSKLERPKLSFPERSKVNFPERTRNKIMNLSEKFSGQDKYKFSFPDRPKFSLPDKSKFKIPERAKISFSTLKMQREPRLRENRNQSTESESDSKKKVIDFDFRKYPRLFTKTKKQKESLQISSPLPRADTPTLPEFATVPRIKTKKHYSENSRWNDAGGYINDEPRQYGNFSLRNINDLDIANDDFQRSIDHRYNTDPPPETEREEENGFKKPIKIQRIKPQPWIAETMQDTEITEITESESNSRESAKQNNENTKYLNILSHQTHRTGVLEEINNDEFFLRQKGISEENIEVCKYLSQEIRDAFREPINSLSQMDKSHMLNEDFIISDMYSKDNKSYSENINEAALEDNPIMVENDDGYYTFPPVRPKRVKKQKKNFATSLEYIDDGSIDNLLKDTENLEISNQNNVALPPRSTENSTEAKRFDFMHDGLVNLNEYENEIDQTKEAPIAPKRIKKVMKRQTSSEQGSIPDECLKDEWVDSVQPSENDIIVHRIEHQYMVPDMSDELAMEPPVAPTRKRSRSRGSRGSCATSVIDDDRTSRGAESLTLDTHLPATGALSISERDLLACSRKSPNYAVVEKLSDKRKALPPRPPAPMKRQRSSKSLGGSRQFFTVPGRRIDSSPPKRPNRNYSTLGPSRPPRKKSTTSLITLDNLRREESSNDFTQYVEIDDDGSEIHRDLQSGEIVNKMKDRPLPPPPIPKRGNKKTKESDDKQESKGKSDQENCTLTSSTPFASEPNQKTNTAYETEEIVEIEVSTQTDPLPEDFNFELSDDEPSGEQKIIFPRTISEIEQKPYRDLSSDSNQDAEILARGLQKFRESSRPSSRSGRASTPISRPKSPTGRISPTAILVERRISSPTRINEEHQIVTTASLTVQPIDDVMNIYDNENETTKILSSESHIVEQIGIELCDSDKFGDNEICEKQIMPSTSQSSAEIDTVKTERLHVSNLDVENLSISELQAHKILVSEIQGLSLKTSEVNTNSGNIVVSGIELAPEVINDIVEKFSKLISEASPNISVQAVQHKNTTDASTSYNNINTFCEEETQTERGSNEIGSEEIKNAHSKQDDAGVQSPGRYDHGEYPPQRPPPPFYPYLQEFSIPSSSFYRLHSPAMERPFTDFYGGESLPAPPKRRKPRPVQESSSDDEEYRPPARKPHHRITEPSVAELSGQLVRACQNSISRTIRAMMSYISEHFTGRDGKKDVQMALVIFLVLIAGLIMLGVGDGRTVHHHHWEFFNPPTDPNA